MHVLHHVIYTYLSTSVLKRIKDLSTSVLIRDVIHENRDMSFFHSSSTWRNDRQMNVMISRYPENLCSFILDATDRFYHFLDSAQDHPLFAYFITISFRKHLDPTLQSVLDILSVVEMADPNATVLLRAEKYSDGEGYHVHVFALTERWLNFRELKWLMYQRGESQFVVHLEKMRISIESFRDTIEYMFKHDNRPDAIYIVKKAEDIMRSVLYFWRNAS